ncbi:tryptophan 7-halogenase [Pectobacterium versatile]|uniref:tryptophan 7-halogenase n=1 Tax=Pectobacterium versatile TaxID=2488639 RepID=UPI001CCD88E5|nr:tryptophan 7-halogenase [Pectobacterium versatile]
MGKIPSHTIIPVTCDVLVIGAGPAGSVASRLLSLAGIRVVLLDNVNITRQKIGESLPGAARPMLHRLGLIPWVEKSAPLTNSGNLSCWGGEQLTATDFIRDPYGCGWHLDRQRFDQNLRDAAEDAGALIVNARLSSLSETHDGMKAQVGEQTITANWVIDASGKSGTIASTLGNSRLKDPPLFALYTWCSNGNVDTRSVVEAAPTGWWYTAGLPDGHRVVAFFTLPSEAKNMWREKQSFTSVLQSTTHVQHWCPPELTSSSRLQIIDATASYLHNVFGSRWIAVGDAALSLDPLSSQGIYNAIYTGLRGAEAVQAVLVNNDRSLLVQYGDRIASIRAAFRDEVSRYYQQEKRWVEKPFWKAHQSERL